MSHFSTKASTETWWIQRKSQRTTKVLRFHPLGIKSFMAIHPIVEIFQSGLKWPNVQTENNEIRAHVLLMNAGIRRHELITPDSHLHIKHCRPK